MFKLFWRSTLTQKSIKMIRKLLEVVVKLERQRGRLEGRTYLSMKDNDKNLVDVLEREII
jgi:hypothetical protein